MEIKNETIRIYEQLYAQNAAFLEEMRVLSKKNHHDSINDFKLGFINNTILKINEFLGKRYIPFPDFKQFELSPLPTVSDVVIMLAQYENAMENFRSEHIKIVDYENGKAVWGWDSEEGDNIRTSPPIALKK